MECEKFRAEVRNFIRDRKFPRALRGKPRNNGRGWQPDFQKRIEVENRAMMQTVGYYKKLGYFVQNVDKDKRGWDLEASFDDKILRVEVKGLSGEDVLIELTPNEYKQMIKHNESYRISIVTNALSAKPRLRIFSFAPESGHWEDEKGNYLTVQIIEAARMYL
jgi:hypothetical protein